MSWRAAIALHDTLNAAQYFQENCLAEHSPLDMLHIKVAIIAIYTVVFLTCLVGNVSTLLVIVIQRSMKTTTNFFLANLVVADILVALFCILQNMYQLVITDHSVWIFGDLTCRLYLFVLHLVPCITVGILVCVSVEKYVAISSPLHSWGTMTKKVRVNMTLSTWLLAFLFNLPYFFTAKLHEFENEFSCSRQMDKVFLRHWVTLSFIFWYFIPLIIIGYIYSKIGLVLWHSVNNTTAIATETDSDYEVQSSRQTKCLSTKRLIRYGSIWSRSNKSSVQWKISETSSNSQYRKIFRNENIEARRKVVRLLIAIVLSFAILTLPHHIRLVYMMWKTDPVICVASYYFYIQPITYLLLFLSSSINPLLYAFFSSKFRSAAYDLLCRRWKRKNLAVRRGRTVTVDTIEIVPGSPFSCKTTYKTTNL